VSVVVVVLGARPPSCVRDTHEPVGVVDEEGDDGVDGEAVPARALREAGEAVLALLCVVGWLRE